MSCLVAGFRSTKKEQREFLFVRSLSVENRTALARSWERVSKFLGGVGSGIKGHTTEKTPAEHAAHVAMIVGKFGPAHAGYEHGPGKHGIPYKGGSKEYHQAQSMIYQKGLKEGTIVKGQKVESSSTAPATSSGVAAPVSSTPSPTTVAPTPSAGTGLSAPTAYGTFAGSGKTFQSVKESAQVGQTIASVPKASGGFDKYVKSGEVDKSAYPAGTLFHTKTQEEHDSGIKAKADAAASQAAAQSKHDVYAKEIGAVRESLIQRTKDANLTDTEKAAITYWSGNSYGKVNGPLHKGEGSVEQFKTAKAISDAINKAPELKTAINVYRGQNNDPGWQAGETRPLIGFHATSIDESRKFGGKVTIDFTTKHGLYIEKMSKSPSERELLLNHGTKIHCTSRTETKDKYGHPHIHFTAEVLG